MTREEITTQKQLDELVDVGFGESADATDVFDLLSFIARRLDVRVDIKKTIECSVIGKEEITSPAYSEFYGEIFAITPSSRGLYGPHRISYRIGREEEGENAFSRMRLDYHRVEPEMPSFKGVARLVQDVRETVEKKFR